VLEPLAASGDTEHRPAGLLTLGRLAVLDGDRPAARRWLTDAMETGDPETEADARVELGRLLAESGDLAASREVLTPLGDRRDATGTQAEDILGELSAGARIVPPALPPRPGAASRALPRSRRTAVPPVVIQGQVEVVPPPGPGPGPAQGARSPGLAPLPPAVLAALATIAEAEGQLAEAGYWRHALASLPGSGPSPAGDGHRAEGGHDGGPAVSGPDHQSG